jgi:formiminotetrahydrofolate cyclodeaminase
MNKEAEGYQERMENCLKEAARPPYMIMKYCCRIIELDERLADIGSKLAVSDAATSVMLAHGAMYGGAVNVFVNTRLMKDREYADKIDEEVNGLLSEYGPRALNCYQKVWERLKG